MLALLRRVQVSRSSTGAVIYWRVSYERVGEAGCDLSTPHVTHYPRVTLVGTAPWRKSKDWAWQGATV